jgi:hypothetical protein
MHRYPGKRSANGPQSQHHGRPESSTAVYPARSEAQTPEGRVPDRCPHNGRQPCTLRLRRGPWPFQCRPSHRVCRRLDPALPQFRKFTRLRPVKLHAAVRRQWQVPWPMGDSLKAGSTFGWRGGLIGAILGLRCVGDSSASRKPAFRRRSRHRCWRSPLKLRPSKSPKRAFIVTNLQMPWTARRCAASDCHDHPMPISRVALRLSGRSWRRRITVVAAIADAFASRNRMPEGG